KLRNIEKRSASRYGARERAPSRVSGPTIHTAIDMAAPAKSTTAVPSARSPWSVFFENASASIKSRAPNVTTRIGEDANTRPMISALLPPRRAAPRRKPAARHARAPHRCSAGATAPPAPPCVPAPNQDRERVVEAERLG